MASNTFLFKPVSESDGNLVILTPNAFNDRIAQVEIVDADGNVIDTGRFAGNQHNGERGHFRFGRPGPAYAGGQVRITFDDGSEPVTIPVGGGGRFESNLGSDGSLQSSGGPSGGGLGGSQIGISPGGNPFVLPSFVDFSALQAPFIDFEKNRDRAREEGIFNKGQIYENIRDSKDSALQLVDTDIEGIQRGLDAFIPQIREQGNIDQQVNIERAGQIDQANFARIPGFNEFNRGQVDRNNVFNQEQRDRAVDASGLDFRRRIGDQLDRLETRATTGRLPGELDKSLSTELANRGSDIGRASGISSISGAGVRANDRLTVGERVNLALSAEQSLPAVLLQGQSVLQAPEERAPTLFAEPQPIPLNQANVADRIPITSNISAGAAQQQIASEVNQYQLLPATQVLSAGIGVDQFNEQGKFQRDLTVLNAQQGQLTATDNAVQGALNQDTAEELRNQQFGAFQQGNQVLQNAQAAQAQGSVAGAIQAVGALSGLGGTGAANAGGGGASSGSSFVDGVINGVGNLAGLAQDGIGGTIDAIGGAADFLFGDGDGVLTIGNQEISSGAFNDFLSGVGDFFTGGSGTISADQELTDINGSPVIQASPNDDGSVTFTSEDGSTQTVTPQSGFSEFFDAITKPFEDAGVDLQTVTQTASAISNWDNLTPAQQTQAASNIAVGVLENRGMLDSETAGDIRRAGAAINVLMNPNSSDSQRAAAVAAAGTGFLNTSFTGTVQNPTTIGGNQVVGSAVTDDGKPGFITQDAQGNTQIVSQADLVNTANTASAIQAFSVLTSNADTEDKVAALAGIGISAGAANNIISQANAGNALAALSIFNLATNFNDMNPVQQAVALTQTGASVITATQQGALQSGGQAVANALGFGSQAATQTATTAGAQAAGQTATTQGANLATQGTGAATGVTAAEVGASNTASTAQLVGGGAAIVGAVGGIALGIDTAADTISVMNDLSTAQAQGAGTASLAASGAAIGAGAAVLAGAYAGGTAAAAAGTSIAAGAAAGAAAGSWAPVVGTAIGAAVGVIAALAISETGTGKNTGQLMRDGWRDGLEQAGFATKNPENGHHELTLADGTKYDIGNDGGHKLQNTGVNVDGNTERYTFDVDWSNPVAVQSIPEAHLFAIATGLDPTTNEGHGLFQRAMAQSLNGATSNATTVEGVRDNFKAMMEGAGVDPRQLAMRIETLRVSNSITDDEYGVYLDRINKTFGTQITPADREQATQAIINQLATVPEDERDPSAQKLYETLTDQEKLNKAQQQLEKRLQKERDDLEKDPKNGHKKPKKPKTVSGNSMVPGSPNPRNAGRPPAGNRQPKGPANITNQQISAALTQAGGNTVNTGPRTNTGNVRPPRNSVPRPGNIEVNTSGNRPPRQVVAGNLSQISPGQRDELVAQLAQMDPNTLPPQVAELLRSLNA